MASEQARRENVVKEREVQVEKDRVPKMTSHFESMAEKSKDSPQSLSHHHKEGESGGAQFVSLSEKGSGMAVSDEGEGETKMKRTQMPHTVGKFVVSSGDKEGTGKKKEEEQEKASLEDIRGHRANAQQKSMDTIRAAEERYNKAKESLSHGGQEGRESGVHVTTHSTAEKGRSGVGGGDRSHGGVGAAPVFGQEGRGKLGQESEAEKARHAQLLAAGAEMKERKGQETVGGGGGGRSAIEGAQKAGANKIDTGSEKTQRPSDYVTDKGRETGRVAAQKGQEAKEQAARAKDTAAEKAQRASQYVTEKGSETASTAAEKAARAKDFALQKAVEAKDIAAEKAQGASQYVTEKGSETANTAAEKAARAKDLALQKAVEAKDIAAEKAQGASQYVTEKGSETANTAAEKAARAKDLALQKAVEAKDIAAEKAQGASQYVTEKGSETANTAAEKAARAKDLALQKAVEAKDIAAEKARVASQYVTEKGSEAGNVAAQKGQVAKEQTVSMTGKAKDYTVQKASEAAEYVKETTAEAAEYVKETTVEGGKGAAHYAGVAAEKAAAVGWTAAHFTTEKVVQGTKAVAGTVEGAVGFAGHKAAEVGSKAVDLTKEKAAAAADTVVGYTARKKEEAQHKDQEMHQGGEEKQGPGFATEPRRGFGEEYGEERGSEKDVYGYGGKGIAGDERRDVGEEYGVGGRGSEKDVFGYGAQGMVGETKRGVGEEYGVGGGRGSERYVEEEGVGAGGVLGAIGETIAEIAQTTKNIVIGDTPERAHEHGTATDYMRQEHGHR